ncbi:MAG: ATP-binding protein [Eubacteriales bacterium]|nr:ATP-binding protein [Eubacteriales bacterium]MDY4213912.1 ATP-binding protein [Eubacteriales bacterium]
MFSKIFFKFSLICVSAVAAVLLIISIIIPVSDTYFYFNRMKSELYTVSESNFGDNLNNIILSQDNLDEKEKNISNLISDYSGQLALNENRKLYIFDKDYNYIAPKEQRGDIREKSENLINVSDEADKNLCSLFGDFIDCAAFTKGGTNSYILYIRDNRTDLRMLIYHGFKFFALGGIISLAAALLVALFLTLRIAKPILKITKRAEGFQQGELYESFDDIKSSEFSGLADAVNHMGYVMTESIQRMNADKHRVEVILEHINNGIMTFDNEQQIIQINSAARRILKIGNKSAKEITFDKFFKELGLEVRMAEFSYLEKSNTIEKEIKNGGGYIKAWFIPFKMDSERNAGVVCVFEDITDQFNVMSAMRKFVADVSHELKTPITVISSYTETVLNSYLDDKAMTANLLNIVYREAGKMTELIQNLLDISKYEMNAVHRHDEPFSIDDMLNSLVETFKLQAEKKELTLKYTRMNEIPEFIGSRGDVERAVKNIISNSIKYTSKGDKINIFAGKLHNDIYIKVEDTGWGIPENKLGHLFERFYRVEDEARSRDKGGTGLGLSIAKEIIESYGGHIKIESEYTKYTRVTITLPIK